MSNNDMLISVSADPASDSWGFVGVVRVGDVEAYRTIEAYPSPAEAQKFAQTLVGDVLGELLAGREWRAVREATGETPTRQDFNLSAFQSSRHHPPQSS